MSVFNVNPVKATKSIGNGIMGVHKKMHPEFNPDMKTPGFEPGKYTSDIKLPDRVGAATGYFGGNEKAYQAKTVGQDPLKEYDYLRGQATDQSRAQAAENTDTLRRKFAAMGIENTGAALKAEDNAQTSAMQRRQDALNSIGFQEAQQRRGMQEAENQKEFQSGEAYKQREFALGERRHNMDLFNKDFEFKQNVAQFDAQSKLKQLDLMFWQAEMDSANTQFNKDLSVYTAKHTGGLLGGGGMAGTGLQSPF